MLVRDEGGHRSDSVLSPGTSGGLWCGESLLAGYDDFSKVVSFRVSHCQFPTFLFGLFYLGYHIVTQRGWFEHQNPPASSSRLEIYDKNPVRSQRVQLGEGLALVWR